MAADATSLALLEALLDVTEQAPVLLTVLLRPEREHGAWRLNDLARQRYPHRHVEILLRPLTDVHAGQLVSNLLATPGFPGEVRDQILMKAEGNPFFVEEVVRGLIESGTLVQEGGEWRAARPVTAFDIPDSIQAVLVSRIDRLSDEARRVLQAASVVGRHFPLDVLKTILAENGRVDAALVDLQRLELVLERRRIPQPEYRVKHALTQEVAYATLIEAERRRLHREVARALEAQYAGRLEEVYGLLAYHYDQSQEEERALHFLVRAGDKSRAEYADAEALRHYARAVELMKRRGEWEAAAKTLMKAALAYHIALDFPAANLAYREAFEILERVRPAAPSPLPPAELRWAVVETGTIDNIGVLTPMSAIVANQVFEGLLRHDQGLNVMPGAARSWKISKDGTRYVFRLHQDRVWSDGRPLTAHDFVFAWLRALRGAQSVLVHDIIGAKRFQQGATDDPASVGVRALDDHTLEVVLDGPRAYFPFILAHPATHPYPRWTIEQYGDDWTAPRHLVANGPYLIVEWERGNRARLVANPRYAGPRGGNVGKVRFIFKDVRDPALFAEGEADVQWLFAFAEDHAARFREYLHLDPPHRILYIFFRCDRQPFNDRRLRLAFAHATDQQALARTGGVHAIPADGAFVPPPIPGHSPHAAVPFDPMRARQLLAEAGVPHGQGLGRFNLLVPSVGDVPIYEVLTKNWKEILGVEVAVTVRGLGYLEWKALSVPITKMLGCGGRYVCCVRQVRLTLVRRQILE